MTKIRKGLEIPSFLRIFVYMWHFKGQKLTEEDIPEGAIGFIYRITRKADGKFYIGKKQLVFTRKKRLTKAEKLLVENKRKTFKRVSTSSGWENYWSSCKDLVADVKSLGEDAFLREIIEFCEDKKSLTYKEVWYQFHNDVLNTNSYNGNILSRFFRKT